ncbi:MAG: hypothetical protein E7673_05380 [Ruminococcaceae bacterium]|nr:hypothetical protein [Oscillospiraceae bacterium]
MKFIKGLAYRIVLILVCLATIGCNHPTYDDSTDDNSATGNENVSSNDSESNNDNSPAPEEPAPPIWMLFSPLEK